MTPVLYDASVRSLAPGYAETVRDRVDESPTLVVMRRPFGPHRLVTHTCRHAEAGTKWKAVASMQPGRALRVLGFHALAGARALNDGGFAW